MKATQWAKINAYLHDHPTATVREIFALGINTPTKRISEMIGAGVPIKSFWDESVNGDGEKVRFKRYYLDNRS